MNVRRNLILEFNNVVDNVDATTTITSNNVDENKEQKKSKITFSNKKKKKCKHCKKKKCIAYKTCKYCSKFYCIKCCGPDTHNCKNLEQYRDVERERLKNKLFSANCNFSKINKI